MAVKIVFCSLGERYNKCKTSNGAAFSVFYESRAVAISCQNSSTVKQAVCVVCLVPMPHCYCFYQQ